MSSSSSLVHLLSTIKNNIRLQRYLRLLDCHASPADDINNSSSSESSHSVPSINQRANRSAQPPSLIINYISLPPVLQQTLDSVQCMPATDNNTDREWWSKVSKSRNAPRTNTLYDPLPIDPPVHLIIIAAVRVAISWRTTRRTTLW